MVVTRPQDATPTSWAEAGRTGLDSKEAVSLDKTGLPPLLASLCLGPGTGHCLMIGVQHHQLRPWVLGSGGWISPGSPASSRLQTWAHCLWQGRGTPGGLVPSKCLKGGGPVSHLPLPLGPIICSLPAPEARILVAHPSPVQGPQQGPLGCGIPVLPSCSRDHQGMAERPLGSQGYAPHGGATGSSPGPLSGCRSHPVLLAPFVPGLLALAGTWPAPNSALLRWGRERCQPRFLCSV